VLIGLSGGIDSSLTAAIAVDAVGRENVTGVAMPGPYSSDHSLTDAACSPKVLASASKWSPSRGL
jgi:NAD+ synthase/NAD+ synthase (glutamine-hydrolysing)